MGFTTIEFCDTCGKRTSKLPYKIVLQKIHTKPYNSVRQVYSKRICESCGKKLTGMKFVGDQIEEQMELKIDEIRINQPRIEHVKKTLSSKPL